jgi:hypothetical protein
MKTFLAIFTGSPEAMEEWKALDPAQREAKEKAGMAAWNAWGDTHQASIVDHGAPLGKTKRISAGGAADIRNNMAAYTLVRAESHADAAQLFERHPHFTIFPGDAVEVMECLPMPGM